jgi:hypothetical protein
LDTEPSAGGVKTGQVSSAATPICQQPFRLDRKDGASQRLSELRRSEIVSGGKGGGDISAGAL